TSPCATGRLTPKFCITDAVERLAPARASHPPVHSTWSTTGIGPLASGPMGFLIGNVHPSLLEVGSPTSGPRIAAASSLVTRVQGSRGVTSGPGARAAALAPS